MSDERVAARAGRFSERSLVQLTLVRYREFLREPEAVFWVFVFPILLAVGLGVAFRDRPQEVLKVGIVAPAADTRRAAHRARRRSRRSGRRCSTARRRSGRSAPATSRCSWSAAPTGR